MVYTISYRIVGKRWVLQGPKEGSGGRVSPRRSDSRERMLRGASELLREYGAGATSIDRVLARTGAPAAPSTTTFPAAALS